MKRTMILALAIVVALLATTVGGTIAWFTDEVTSASNVITAGNLDIELDYSTDLTNWKTVEGASDLFNPDALWEPGHTEYVYLRLVNKGDLALKYELSVNYEDTVIGKSVLGNDIYLHEHLAFDVVDVSAPFADRAEARAAAANAQKLDAYAVMGGMTEQDETRTMAMVIFMPETVGNEANYRGSNVPKVTLGVKLQATQLTHESDSFDNTYDSEANPPYGAMKEENKELILPSGDVEVEIPASAPAGIYTLKVGKVDKTIIKNDQGDRDIVLTMDMELKLDGQKVESGDGIVYDVRMKVEPFIDIKSLTCGGKEITGYSYQHMGEKVSFQADSFGKVEMKYDQLTEGLRMDENGKITGGFFMGVDPAQYDPSLANADSEYIIVDYVEDGKNYYYVGHHDAVKIVTTDGNYTWKRQYDEDNIADVVITYSHNAMWSIVSNLKNKDYAYVLLAPGTYTAATTVGVYSSMTVAGLGAAEEVTLIKGASSGSNRHLINVSNAEKPDYIEVVVRNLTLDVPNYNEKNGTKEDNAAVQSIRKSKVKCYNLIINKSADRAGWGDRAAFYVNGNNAHNDGKKYPAYLYAEDVTMTANPSMSVVSFAGTYKFFHDGVTNDGEAYTSNSGSIKNKPMFYDDWEWD